MYGCGDSGLEHAFGKSISIYSDPSRGQYFNIRLDSLPQEACIDLLTQNWEKVSAGIIMIGYRTKSREVFYCASSYSDSICSGCKQPIEIDQANECDSRGTSIYFYYK